MHLSAARAEQQEKERRVVESVKVDYYPKVGHFLLIVAGQDFDCRHSSAMVSSSRGLPLHRDSA
jgi:hypothetical protein